MTARNQRLIDNIKKLAQTDKLEKQLRSKIQDDDKKQILGSRSIHMWILPQKQLTHFRN